MAKKDKGQMTADPVSYQIPDPAGGVRMETFISWTLVKRGVRREVITPLDAPESFMDEKTEMSMELESSKDSPLIRALGLTFYWQSLLDDAKANSYSAIADIEGVDRTHVSRVLQLASLAPEIVNESLCCKGNGLVLDHLLRGGISRDWRSQRGMICCKT